MKQSFRQVFKNISESNPPAYLESAILRMIEAERERKIKNNLFLSYISMFVSAIAFISTSLFFGSAILQSEFWNIASLVRSDILTVAGNWKDFAYSLLETFPVINALAILVPLFVLFLSISFYLSNKKNNHQAHFHKLSLIN